MQKEKLRNKSLRYDDKQLKLNLNNVEIMCGEKAINHCKAFKNYDTVKPYISGCRNNCKIAISDGNTISGIITYHITSTGQLEEIQYLKVFKDYRNKGIAQILINTVLLTEDINKKHGVWIYVSPMECDLETDSENSPLSRNALLDFYRKYQYKDAFNRSHQLFKKKGTRIDL